MSKKNNAFCSSSELSFEDMGEGVKRQIMVYDDEIMMVKVIFEKGAIGNEHHHPHRQVCYVASGAFEVTINGVKEVLKGGDSFYAAPDVSHGVVCIESGTLIDVFNPMRKDFLK